MSESSSYYDIVDLQIKDEEQLLLEKQKKLEASKKTYDEAKLEADKLYKAFEESKKSSEEALQVYIEDRKTLESSQEELKRLIEYKVYYKGREAWLHQKDLVYKIILSFSGLIYGGTASNFVLHDYWVGEYRKYCKYLKESDNEETRDELILYNNSAFHPVSFKGRTDLPRDYDVYIREADFDILMKYFEENYVINMIPKQSPYFITTRKYLKYLALSIIPKNCINGLDITMYFDFIIFTGEEYRYKHYMPPYSNLDFRCNSLCLRKGSMGVEVGSIIKTLMESKISLLEKLDNKILESKLIKESIEDNIEKKAVAMFFHICNSEILRMTPRIQKMKAKGYTLDLSILFKNFSISRSGRPMRNGVILNSSCKCYICQEDDFSSNVAIKPCICEGILHVSCFKQHIDNEIRLSYETNSQPNCNFCRRIYPENAMAEIQKVLDLYLL